MQNRKRLWNSVCLLSYREVASAAFLRRCVLHATRVTTSLKDCGIRRTDEASRPEQTKPRQDTQPCRFRLLRAFRLSEALASGLIRAR